MRFLISAVIWLVLLGIGGSIGHAIGDTVGAIVGVIVAQAIMATSSPGLKYPGDTNF